MLGKPDEMIWRADFGVWAVVFPPLFYKVPASRVANICATLILATTLK